MQGQGARRRGGGTHLVGAGKGRRRGHGGRGRGAARRLSAGQGGMIRPRTGTNGREGGKACRIGLWQAAAWPG